MAQENTVLIDNQTYKVSDLTPEVTAQLTNLQVNDQEIARQESLLAMLRTSRAAYGRKLAEAIKDIQPQPAAKKATVNDKAAPKAASKTASKAKPATKSKAKK